MRNLKKVLALVLALVMSLSLVTIANASDFADADDITYEEAVDVLTALKVIEGVGNNTFNPTGNVTRAQMAKMITIVSLGNVEPSAFLGTTTDLTDIDGHWAEAYIKYCYSQGIISGKGAGIFDPNANVTCAEAAKMLLVAIGYNSDVQGYTGARWAINVQRDAQTSKFYKDMAVPADNDLTRDQAAQLIYNAVQAPIIEKFSSVDRDDGTITDRYEPSADKTLLTETFEGDIKLGYLSNYSYDTTKALWTYTFTNATGGEFGGNVLTGNDVIPSTGTGSSVVRKSAEDYTGLYGQQVKVVYSTKDNDVIYGVFANDSSVVVEGATGNVEDYNNTNDTVTVAGTDYKLNNDANTIDVYDFGNGNSGLDLDDLKANATGTNLSAYTFKMVDNTGDGKIDAVIRTPMTIAKINYVGTTTMQLGSGIGTQDLDDLVTYDGYAAGDWVCFINSTNAAKKENTIQKIDLQTAAVSGVRGGANASTYTEYQINGEWLAASGNATYTGSIAKADVNDTVEYVALGSTIFYAKIVDIAATTKNIAMIVTADDADETANNVHSSVAEAKLLMADGTTKVVTVSKITYYTGSTATVDTSVDASDITTNLGIGQLVTYRVDGSDYELTQVCASNLAGYKAMVTENTATNIAYNNGKIAGVELADDAVVYYIANATATDTTDDGTFNAAATRKSDIYTGKEIKNTWGTGTKTIANADHTDTSTVDYVTVLTQEVNGFTYAKVVLIADETKLPTVTSGSNYGYLAAATYRTIGEDGKTYLNYTIHTADGKAIQVKEENTDAPDLYPQGAVVTYDVVSDGVVKNVSKPNVTTGWVTGWDGSSKIALDGVSTEIDTKDTTIIYVDSAKKVGAEGGSIQKFADYNGNGVVDGSEPANVRYVLSASGDYVVMLLVDVNNDMKANPVTVSLSGALTAADIQSALVGGSATVDASALTTAGSVSVADGQTLTVTDTSTSKALTVNVANGATLKVTDASITDGMLIANVAPGGAVELPNGKLFGTGAAATVASGSVEVKANGTGVTITSSNAEIKLNASVTLGASDLLALSGTAKLTGKSGVSITFRNTSQNYSNVGAGFYSNNGTQGTTDATAASSTVTANDTFDWETVYIGGSGATATDAWAKR